MWRAKRWRSRLLGGHAWLLLVSGCANNTLNSGSPVAAGSGPAEAVRCEDYASCEFACREGRAGACTDLARLFESGKGAPQNLPRAAELYQQACKMKERDACAHLGLMYDVGLGVTHDLSYAAYWYETACALGDSWSCARKRRLADPRR
jgi:uncharacterized protein